MWPLLGKIATIVAAVLLYLWNMREAVRCEIDAEDNGEQWV